MTDTGMYNWRVEAIRNALEQKGKATGPLTIEDLVSLGHLDQYHYYGIEACDHVASMLGLEAGSKVLDVGSGIGGPARYLAMKTGCDVTGVELQADLTEAAAELTERVGLKERVRFVTGDFVESFRAGNQHLKTASFDHFISQLVFLHIPGRDELLKACYETMKPGGTFCIEDFVLIGPAFTTKEDTQLRTVVNANTVTSNADYIAALEEAGFVDIEVVDMTQGWASWSRARSDQYIASKKETVAMHGERLFTDRSAFYGVVADLFEGGNLGGSKITGRRRGVTEDKLIRGRATAQPLGVTNKAVLNEYGSKVNGSPTQSEARPTAA